MKSVLIPLLLIVPLSVAQAAPPISGTVEVIENDTLNNSRSVTLSFAEPAPAGVGFYLPASNRGDYVLDLLRHADDAVAGVLLSCVAQRVRNNGAGAKFATTSAAIVAEDDQRYFIPVHDSPGGLEFNANA